MFKKIVFIIIVLLGIIFLVNLIVGSNKNNKIQSGEIISIEIKQEVPYIVYLDNDDLNSQISKALSIIYLSVPEKAIIFSHSINSKMSEVTIQINIKEEFKNLYRFSEDFDNKFIIDIQSMKDALGDSLM